MDAETLIRGQEQELSALFAKIDEVALYNQEKVLNAFRVERVALRHFVGTTGYGYGDEGRETLGKVFARAFGAERAVVSPALLSGTHALTVALFGLLRPSHRMLCITGTPYDTIRGVLWGEGNGSLADYNVSCDVVPLSEAGKVDLPAVQAALHKEQYKVVYIQRSRGYELRDAFSIAEIEAMCTAVREAGFTGCIFVDNCYGEFVERQEPTQVGADLIVGSLIKNPGGGLAPTGGYIAGGEEYVLACENRLTAPGVGGEVGSYAYGYQLYFEGFFLAPHAVAQALKGGLLIGRCLEALGCENYPAANKLPTDITRAVRFPAREPMEAFIRAVQATSPIDSFVRPEAWDMPGYDCEVIMAAGTFNGGSTIELSADAPIRAPYIAYFQGGLTYEHCRIALKEILKSAFALS